MTGLASLLEEIVAKQVELLTATIPNAQRLAILTNPANTKQYARDRERAASSKGLGLDLASGSADVSARFENALRDLARSRSGRADRVARRLLPFAKPQGLESLRFSSGCPRSLANESMSSMVG